MKLHVHSESQADQSERGSSVDRQYTVHLLYRPRSDHKLNVYVAITWALPEHLKVLKALCEEMRAERWSTNLASVTLQREISLEIPMEGFCIDSGYKIEPLATMLTKANVDSFEPGLQPRCFQLTATFENSIDSPTVPDLKYELVLNGIEGPSNLLTIDINPSKLLQRMPKWKAYFAYRYWKLNAKHPDGEGVLIAVLDTGVNVNHEALKDKVKYARNLYQVAEEALSSDANIDDTDSGCHGTGVASVAAGKHISSRGVKEKYIGVDYRMQLGVAPGASLVVCRVAENCSLIDPFSIVEALKWIYDHNALVEGKNPTYDKDHDTVSKCQHIGHFDDDEVTCEKNRISIVSMSFRLGNEVDGLHDVIKKLTAQGVLCVAAAGNDGLNEDPGWPGKYDECLTVGAVNYGGEAINFLYHWSLCRRVNNWSGYSCSKKPFYQ